MYKKIFYILLFSCFYLNAQSEEITPEEDYYEDYYENTVYEDESDKVEVIEFLASPVNQITSDTLVQRNFKADLSKKYSGDEFDYTKTKPKESLWSKFKRALSELISRIFSNSDATAINRITEIVIYIFSGIIVALFIYYLIKLIVNKKGNLLFSKKDKKVDIYDTDIIEDINEIDFPAIISQYELEQNYNAAFRYQFLSVLKNLTDVDKIKWTQDKTNIDYLNELKDPKIKAQFKRAVYIFDHVWYGDFKINQVEYQKFVQEIQPLKTNTYE
ncbi:DUF4129 domain-containing protein [Weeksellaceae bacterium TAE3-ERU29]|nr:DUF4129 domain-containing protein [Weeksellaceae bacterium TAE3-ERU29]